MQKIDLTAGVWQLSGWTPDLWRLGYSMELGLESSSEVSGMPCRVPGSVQLALHEAGILPDWNVGLNSRLYEWVENRHWIYETQLPPMPRGSKARLSFDGLDGFCEIWVGKTKIGVAKNAFVPHEFEFEPPVEGESRWLRVIFTDQPRWLGQIGFTSRIKDWKPRFNYGWDWIPRLVQIGIYGKISLEIGARSSLETLRFFSDYEVAEKCGALHMTLAEPAREPLRLVLSDGDFTVAEMVWPADQAALTWPQIPVVPWQPNGCGEAVLYSLVVEGASGESRRFKVGFKHAEWKKCEGAPDGADPWICHVNGTAIFLQGVNWTPIRPNFADLKREDYELRLRSYRDLGVNCIRVWGGGFPEDGPLYELCDELGILLWQDLPLSSSGLDNWPPEDEEVIREAEIICRSYAIRKQKHVSLLFWCGGNELQSDMEGRPMGIGKPVGLDHPLIAAFARIIGEVDPDRRFVPSSSSGPRFLASHEDFGRGLHWDVHGPWILDAVGIEPWQDYWREDDAMFRSEFGNPGAQSADLIRGYLGECDFFDAKLSNPYWQRFGWWFEMPAFLAEWGEGAWEIEDYVNWSQKRQAEKLGFVAGALKSRFPRCGGMLVWMGHDSFPCAVNTSVLDFRGRPKPAALALGEVFRAAAPHS